MPPEADPVWNENFSDEHKEALKGFESQEKLFEAINYKIPEAPAAKDWRDGLDGEEKKTADRFDSPGAMVRSIQSARQRESLVRVPGKDSTAEDKATYYKAIGVPDKPEGYVFTLPEGQEPTAESDASNKEWGKRLHALNVPVETVNKLIGFLQEDTAGYQAAQVAADADFVAESEAILKAEWKGEEYGKNVEVANKAFKEVATRAGIDLEDLTTMETSDGRFIMDDPRMVRIFAAFGREMAEGSLGPTLTDGERDTMQEQLSTLREKMEAASQKGNSKEANRLYQQEQALIAKMDGNKPIN